MIRLIRSELYKFATTPGPWVLIVLTVALTAAAIAASLAGNSFNFAPTTDSLRTLLGAGHVSALLVAPIVGVLCITTEYRHKVLTTTLLASPRRQQVLAAKAVACVAWSLLLGVVSLVMVAAMGLPWMTSKGVPASALTAQVGPVIPGLLAVFALLSLFGLGIGTLVKNQVAGVLVILGGTAFLEPILTGLFHQIGINLNWLPSEAAIAVAGQLNGGGFGPEGYQQLTWWQGVLALVAWSGGTALLGYFTTFRRDVT